jgi:polyferredoxin
MPNKTPKRNYLKPEAKNLASTRRFLAAVMIILLTLLFLDFTGSLYPWLGWAAKLQILPLLLSGSLLTIVLLALCTLLFGRVYCAIICPLGICQDAVSNISGRRKGKKNRFRRTAAKPWLRRGILILYAAALILGINMVVSILDPYSAYGRIASNFFAPVYRWGNNLLSFFAEAMGSYTFSPVDVWMRGWATFGIAFITLAAVGILAWRNGRTYCNTVCPVGTTLGLISKYAIFKPSFIADKCTSCKACEHSCKASCLDSAAKSIDYSRCVACCNCIEKCNSGAMTFAFVGLGNKKTKGKAAEKNAAEKTADADAPNAMSMATAVATTTTAMQGALSRRGLLAMFGAAAASQAIKAPELYVDGGLADIADKKIPLRETPVLPPGALAARHMKRHCTACQLCVSTCPNNVLRPSSKATTFMQPEMSFERGYCRPECTDCSQICPISAIVPVTAAEKTEIKIGHAVWLEDKCVVVRDGVQCDNCKHHCPTEAITLVDREPGNSKSLKIPVIDKELCIGCGACEYLCPARPFSAIYVEGHAMHHMPPELLEQLLNLHIGHGGHTQGEHRQHLHGEKRQLHREGGQHGQ